MREIKLSESSKIELRIFSYFYLAIQYYIHARHAIFCHSIQVGGNLSHHAIEMILHAGLASNFTYEELKRKYSKHNLIQMWGEFKNIYLNKKINKYNKFINKYNKWEKIRYPSDRRSDIVMFSDIHKTDQSEITFYGNGKYEEYRINLEELDEFFKEIITVIDINPEHISAILLTQEAKDTYIKKNNHRILFGKDSKIEISKIS